MGRIGWAAHFCVTRWMVCDSSLYFPWLFKFNFKFFWPNCDIEWWWNVLESHFFSQFSRLFLHQAVHFCIAHWTVCDFSLYSPWLFKFDFNFFWPNCDIEWWWHMLGSHFFSHFPQLSLHQAAHFCIDHWRVCDFSLYSPWSFKFDFNFFWPNCDIEWWWNMLERHFFSRFPRLSLHQATRYLLVERWKAATWCFRFSPWLFKFDLNFFLTKLWYWMVMKRAGKSFLLSISPTFFASSSPLVARRTVEGRNLTLPFLSLFNAQCLVWF